MRACLLDNDIISAVEALEEMQFLWTSNHSMNEGYNQQLVQYESIKDLMAAVLVQQQNTAMIDELYFALVDQVRRGQNVPRIALDAIVEAAGRMDLFDRAFATFQEYGPIFRIQPDIHSHNSLLSSCVSGTRVNMHTLLAIFQDIENTVRSDGTAVQPNSTSYSLLLEAMVDTDDFRVFDDVLKQMIAANIRPSSRSLRRCIIAFALKGNWVMVDALSDHLVYLQNGRPLPAFLSIRLKAIRNRT